MMADGGQVCEIGEMSWRFKESEWWNKDNQLVTRPAESRAECPLQSIRTKPKYEKMREAWFRGPPTGWTGRFW
jgi:hypothetical protein